MLPLNFGQLGRRCSAVHGCAARLKRALKQLVGASLRLAWQEDLFDVVMHRASGGCRRHVVENERSAGCAEPFSTERSKCLGWHLRSGAAGNWLNRAMHELTNAFNSTKMR